MVYRGRIVGLGLTAEGNPAALYGVTGRSESSKARKGRYFNDDWCVTRGIQIGPLGELTPEQKEKAHLFFYTAMLAKPKHKLEGIFPYLVVSNGEHTDEIAELRWDNPNDATAMIRTLRKFGHEPDKLCTPRIAGEFTFDGTYHTAVLGIITKEQSSFQQYMPVGCKPLTNGVFKTISTYDGKDDVNPTAPIFKESIDEIILEMELNGETPQELAKEFYNALDENIRVISAAAVLINGEWQMSRKDLHGVKS